MDILLLVGRELNYPRNDVLLRALRRLGKVQVLGDTRLESLSLRIMRVFFRALPHLLLKNYDLIFVGFYGHLLMLPVGILSRPPIIFDAFVSTYDTLCFDRAIFSPTSLLGRLAYWLDQTSCRLADLILLDTLPQAEYFTRTFGLNASRVKHLPVGCNEDIFYPRPQVKEDKNTYVLYYSTYLPLHGVETVVRAAGLLHDVPSLRFRLIGDGPDYIRIRCLADKLGIYNIVFVPTVPLETLANEIAAADICLGGHFGRSDKSRRVIPGKIYQILAMGRPLIAADTPANRYLLSDGINALLCPQDNPEALAATILKLHQDKALQDQIAIRGRALYLERCSEAVITEHLHDLIGQVIGKV